MTKQETRQIEIELKELLITKYSDIIVHVDVINGTNRINISLFWNRISRGKWKGAKTFRMEAKVYPELLKSVIIPFFIK